VHQTIVCLFSQELLHEDLRLLVERIAAGDQHAFRRLFDLHFSRLIQFARSIIRTNEGAIEVVDDVFIKLWKQKEQILAIKDLKAYLYTGVKNTALNYLSKKAAQQTEDPFDHIDILLSRDQHPDQKMITAEIMEQIQVAVEALPPRCKMVFKLVREDGLKYREVAQILNVSVDTVDAQMVIAVRRIREKVQKHVDFPFYLPLKK
jgi:RNA polymerase sigma-70 factor (ECF subfamily)